MAQSRYPQSSPASGARGSGVQRRVLLHPRRRVQLPSLRRDRVSKRGNRSSARTRNAPRRRRLVSPAWRSRFPSGRTRIAHRPQPFGPARASSRSFSRADYPGGVGVRRRLREPSVRVRHRRRPHRDALAFSASVSASSALFGRRRPLALLHGAGAVSLEARRACRRDHVRARRRSRSRRTPRLVSAPESPRAYPRASVRMRASAERASRWSRRGRTPPACDARARVAQLRASADLRSMSATLFMRSAAGGRPLAIPPRRRATPARGFSRALEFGHRRLERGLRPARRARRTVRRLGVRPCASRAPRAARSVSSISTHELFASKRTRAVSLGHLLDGVPRLERRPPA